MDRSDAGASNWDVGDYCRQVEAYLTRANGGHLVRVVGPAFELVRSWALDGVPLRVVYRAIDDKAERHRAGASTRPLRIEYCEADVRETFDAWRRAVGVTSRGGDEDDAGGAAETAPAGAGTRRNVPLSRQLDRIVERLSRVIGRMDLPEAVRDAAAGALAEYTTVREQAAGARGAARASLVERLPDVHRGLMAGVRQAVGESSLRELRVEAEQELAPYRGRIAPEAWTDAVDVTIDRLLRERFGLPEAVS